jgi:hypothetical protein
VKYILGKSKMSREISIQNTKDNILGSITGYLSGATVHGFRYIVEGRNKCEKFFWIALIITSFIMSGNIIYTSYLGWNDTPLQTTIEKVDEPVQKYPFPAVTVCDPGQLQIPRRNRWIFPEQLLNWIDISDIRPNGTPSLSTVKAETNFQLTTLRRKLGNLLEQNTFVPFTKSCFSKRKFSDYSDSCGKILEFLILSNNVEGNMETLYKETLKRWDDSYPDRKCFGRHNVMKKDLFLIYKKLFFEKHQLLKRNLTSEELDRINNVTMSKGETCKITNKCTMAMNKIMETWKKLDNRIRFNKVCHLGSVISNFHFMLENQLSNRNTAKIIQSSISSMMMELYPNLMVESFSFTDMLGFLGYETHTDFVSFTDQVDPDEYETKLSTEYQATMSTLHPLDSFRRKDGQFMGIIQTADKKEKCNLFLLYSEWINYFIHRQSASCGKTEGKVQECQERVS